MIPTQTRAVSRNLKRGQMVWCSGRCKKLIKGNFKIGVKQGNTYIVANIYKRGKWKDTEFWCCSCYLESGQPYGKVIE